MRDKLCKALPAISLLLAAPLALGFDPALQPPGYIAAPAVSKYNLSSGNEQVFQPWAATTAKYGDLNAFRLNSDGTAASNTPLWSLKTELDAATWSQRKIMTNVGSSAQAYGCYNGTGGADTLKYFCGERSNEVQNAGTLRNRQSRLGSILHSNPVYVGPPSAGYSINDYSAWAASKAGRKGRVYVGANDGILHAVDASNDASKGEELFGYVPGLIHSSLGSMSPAFSSPSYQNTYLVDGPITVGDVYYDSAWHTLLVGGLGAGGKGFYALDVTEDAIPGDEGTALLNKFRWEFTHASLGYSYGKPSIVKINVDINDPGAADDWAVILANGYQSSGGSARLFILNAKTGAPLMLSGSTDYINLESTTTTNGLSSPLAISSDDNLTADIVYAGDLNGNLWKLDISASTLSQWGIATLCTADCSGTPTTSTSLPLFSQSQAITSAPDVGKHPHNSSDYLVFFGTGKLLEAADTRDTSLQSLYGIWDRGDEISSGLLAQNLKRIDGSSSFKTLTANPIDWASHNGWRLQLQTEPHNSTSAVAEGDKIIQDLQFRDGRVHLMLNNPVNGENWLLQADGYDGGLPDTIIFDEANRDGVLDASDNVGGVRVAVVRKEGVLVSKPTIARSGNLDISLISQRLPLQPPGAAVCKKMLVDLKFFNIIDGSDRIQFDFNGQLGNGADVNISVSNLMYEKDAEYDIAMCTSWANGVCFHNTDPSHDNDTDEAIHANLFKKKDGVAYGPGERAVITSTTNGNGNGTVSLDFSDMSWDGQDNFDFYVVWNSPYKLSNFSYSVTADEDIEEIEGHIQNCSEDDDSGNYDLVDNGIQDVDDGVTVPWNSTTNTATFNNIDEFTFNSSGADPTEATIAPETTPSQHKANNELTGRIRWRELLF